MRASDPASSVACQPATARPAPAVLLLPALEDRLLVSRPRLVEQRPHDLEQLRRSRMRLRRRPADDCRPGLRGERRLDPAAQLLGRDHHQPHAVLQLPVDLAAHRLQVPVDELVEVSLVASLRPAPLVVLPRLLLALVGDLDETARLEAKDTPPLARNDRDERPLAGERVGERRHVERPRDLDGVAERAHERNGLEHVRRGREDRVAAGAVPLEPVAQPGPDPGQRVPQGDSAVPALRQLLGVLLRSGEHGAELRLHVRSRRDRGRVEVDVDADRAAVVGPESRQVAQDVVRNGGCHGISVTTRRGSIPRPPTGTSSRRLTFTTAGRGIREGAL